MLYPVIIYFIEIQWRLLYCILSLILAVVVTFYFIDLIFLYEVYPFIKILHKKFIATHITELFDSAIYLSFFIACICTSPLVFYHIFTFFSNSWFSYQINLLRVYLWMVLFLILTVFLVINFSILPKSFEFFTYWEIRQNSSLLQLQLDARIYSYLIWVISIYNFISFFFILLITFCFFAVLFITPSYFYLFMKYFKNQIWFFIVTVLFIFLPSDFFLQIISILNTMFLIELTFLVSCFRIAQIIAKISGSSIGQSI